MEDFKNVLKKKIDRVLSTSKLSQTGIEGILDHLLHIQDVKVALEGDDNDFGLKLSITPDDFFEATGVKIPLDETYTLRKRESSPIMGEGVTLTWSPFEGAHVRIKI